MSGYTPMADPERAERIRRWHEGAHASGKAEGRSEQTFSYLGRSLVVPPGVMPITGVSHLLGKAVLAEVRAGDSVLDMGTASCPPRVAAGQSQHSVEHRAVRCHVDGRPEHPVPHRLVRCRITGGRHDRQHCLGQLVVHLVRLTSSPGQVPAVHLHLVYGYQAGYFSRQLDAAGHGHPLPCLRVAPRVRHLVEPGAQLLAPAVR